MNRHIRNLQKLSKGEHSLKEVLKLAGFEPKRNYESVIIYNKAEDGLPRREAENYD